MISPIQSQDATLVPPLRDGDRLTMEEFERRWDAMPNLQHAELLGGRVYMNPPPISGESHGRPQWQMMFCLGHFEVATPGLETLSESSTHFGPQDLPQPDGVLRIKEQYGGASRFVRGELHGAPELIVEVSYSSERRDLGIKKQRYAANGVQEYLIWLVAKRKFVWFSLQEGEYVELEQLRNGVIKSHVFPGLWLDTKGMLADNWLKILATLRKGMASPEYIEFAKRLKSQGRKKRKS